MSVRGLQKQVIQLPIAAGLNQKMDTRAIQGPTLTIATDIQFDEVGGVQTRYPFGATDDDIFGGSTITDARRIVNNGNERLLFTKDALYSWNAQLSKWVSKGTHLAVKVEEESKFVTTGDQVNCDRCELLGTVFYSWHETVGGASTAYVAAVDATTGAVLMAPYELAGFSRTRLTALATKVLLSFYDNVNGVYGYMLDPASPATALAGSSTTLSSSAKTHSLGNHSAGPYYDVVKVPLADQAVFVVSQLAQAAYTIGTITADLTVARASAPRNSASAITVSCEPTGTSVQVLRGDAGAIEGDLITISTLADVYVNQAVGTYSSTLNQIAAAHRSTQDSAVYRCYAFWSSSETTGSANWESRSNWVSTGNTLGTEATFVRKLGVATRAFDHDGRIYVWMAFAGASTFPSATFGAQLQNTYFLYRDDAFLCAKSTMHRAAGFSSVTGCLPGVQSTSAGVFSWCGGERRIIQLGGNQSGYAARAPRDITITFDSNEARRCARIGQTLYISGGELLQYDGVRLTEVGFHIYPWDFSITSSGASGLANGTYAYRMTWRWDNAQGDLDRSTTAAIGTITISGGPKTVAIGSASPLYTTHKTDDPIAYEIWRTAVNPTEDSPYYLVSDKDPGQIGAATNEYVENDTTADNLPTFSDILADTTLIAKESNIENGAVLEFLAPPAATIIIASAERLFLAGVAGDPHRVWYSRLRQDGEVASFHDALTANVPPSGGAITALAFLNETLVVFKETAIYALPGDGLDNVGQGQNYGPARLLSSDVGAVNHESVALTPAGLIFKSSKGWYLLGKGWEAQYIGAPVCDYDSETVVAVHVVESQHQVRCLTTARLLVLDYLVNQWAEWTVDDGLSAAIWGGSYAYLTSTGPRVQASTYALVDYGLDVEMLIKPGDLQGFARVKRLLVLGEYRSLCRVRIRLANNYGTSYFDDEVWTPQPATVGGPLQVEHGPSDQQCEAFRVRITAVSADSEEGAYGWPTGEAIKLTGLGLELGFKQGLYRRLPAAQRQ